MDIFPHIFRELIQIFIGNSMDAFLRSTRDNLCFHQPENLSKTILYELIAALKYTANRYNTMLNNAQAKKPCYLPRLYTCIGLTSDNFILWVICRASTGMTVHI